MNKKTATKIMIALLAMVFVFHVLIFFEFLSYEKVWAGKLQSLEEMRIFEGISMIVNLIMLLVFGIKLRQLNNKVNNRFINIFIWIFASMFILNTIGNLFAKNIWELIIGTTLTLASAVLCVIIAKKEKLHSRRFKFS